MLEPYVYYGTSDFSSLVLTGLLQAGWTPQLVVTTLPRRSGRGLGIKPTPIAQAARSAGLKVVEIGTLRSPEALALLARAKPRFAVLAAFGKIIPPNVLALYPKGIVNVHPSLLPLYRGASPIQSAIRDGAHETGVSLILLDDEVDHGPILAQARYGLTASDDALTIGRVLAESAVGLLVDCLPRYLSGELQAQPQDHNLATFTKIITRDDGRADFSKAAIEIDRQRRAFAPWPGLWTLWRDRRLKIISAAVRSDYHGPIGVAALEGDSFVIGCGSGGLVVTAMQLEGGRELSTAELLRGHPGLVGARLE